MSYESTVTPSSVRTKPMRLLALGLPRTGTESLRSALLMLGFDSVYHGWTLAFEKTQGKKFCHRIPGTDNCGLWRCLYLDRAL